MSLFIIVFHIHSSHLSHFILINDYLWHSDFFLLWFGFIFFSSFSCNTVSVSIRCMSWCECRKIAVNLSKTYAGEDAWCEEDEGKKEWRRRRRRRWFLKDLNASDMYDNIKTIYELLKWYDLYLSSGNCDEYVNNFPVRSSYILMRSDDVTMKVRLINLSVWIPLSGKPL